MPHTSARFSTVFLRCALGLGFLSAVADRFGLWGSLSNRMSSAGTSALSPRYFREPWCWGEARAVRRGRDWCSRDRVASVRDASEAAAG